MGERVITTVGELLDALESCGDVRSCVSDEVANTEVRFATGPAAEMHVLSVYEVEDDGVLWLDIEPYIGTKPDPACTRDQDCEVHCGDCSL